MINGEGGGSEAFPDPKAHIISSRHDLGSNVAYFFKLHAYLYFRRLILNEDKIKIKSYIANKQYIHTMYKVYISFVKLKRQITSCLN